MTALKAVTGLALLPTAVVVEILLVTCVKAGEVAPYIICIAAIHRSDRQAPACSVLVVQQCAIAGDGPARRSRWMTVAPA
ncbi:MAG: hypothetical protein IPP88_15600 [Betaproteobacteria bacterium]|nr:hypothetical protein [Betaproteobacteria bacterium]